MNRIDRLFGILTLLQSKKYMQAEAIAGHFGISVRTVYRDIKALGEQGIPVSFEQPKGYFLVQGYFLPPLAFSSDEANALLLMESVVAGFADKSIKVNYSNALNKIKSLLRHSEKEKLDLLSKNIRFQVPACMSPDFEYLSTLQHAISTRNVVELAYTNNKTESSQRQVEPIGLIFYAFSWHVVAWCHKRSQYRDFKVSRITRLTCMGMPFKKTDHIELNEYMKLLPVDY